MEHRRLLLLALISAFLPVLVTPHLLAQEVDTHNPIGIAGIFNGNITTACSYDPLTHSASREVTDMVVPGSVGKYPLKLTRYYNSRGKYGGLGPGWSAEYWWSLSQGGSVITYPNGNVLDKFCQQPVGISDNWQSGPLCDGNGCDGDFRLADGGTVHFVNGAVTSIDDPYGHTTTITYTSNTMKVTEPGDRYLLFTYNGPQSLLSRVEAHGLGNATVTDWVNYSYTLTSPGGNGASLYCLTGVAYSDGTSASYTYTQDNVQARYKVLPLLATANDIRYNGPMRQIAYDYQGYPTPHGAITAERFSAGGTLVSRITPGATLCSSFNCTMETDFTETRGDGPPRTFHYTDLHYHSIPGEPGCPEVIGTDPPSQFLLTYTDFQNHTTQLGYDENWYVNSVTDANNHTTYYTRGTNIGEITQIKHPDNTHIDYTYYAEGTGHISGHYLQQITDERGNITYHYRDGNHRITRTEHRDQQGNVLAFEEFAYANNNFGLLSTHHLPSAPNWNGPYEHFQYDNRGLLIAKTNATTIADWQTAINTAPKTTYIYYASGPWVDRVQTMTLPANVSGLQASETYEYDKNAAGSNVPGRGLVTKISHNDNNHTYQSFGYDAYGNKLWEENELRGRTSYTYDGYNRLLTVTRPLNGITTYTYNPTNGTGSPYKHTTNNPDTITTATNIVTSNVYDQNFRKTSSSVAGRTTWFDYDPVGNQRYVTDPRGTGSGDAQFTIYTDYDGRNRKSQIREPLSHTTQFRYEDGINLTTIIRPDTFSETKSYDAMNRLISHTVPKSAGVSLTTYFGYWPSGKLFWVQDPNGQTTFLVYNESDQLNVMYYPGLTQFQAWAYDDAHNLQNRTTVNGEIQSFSYDIRNRKTGMSWSNNADLATYSYDDVGRLTSAANLNSTVTRQYDDAGRLILDQQNIAGFGTKSVNYPTYDADGRLTRMNVSGVPDYDYTFSYDAMGRFEKIFITNSVQLFQYHYDAASNEIQRDNLYNGVTQSYPRDALNRMLYLDVRKGNNTLGHEGYGYDAMSRLWSVTREDNKQDQFGYYRDGELNWVLYGTSPTPTPSPPPSPTPPPGGTPTPTPPGGQVAEPWFSPGGGNICPYYNITVTISTTTAGAQLRYTLNGTNWTVIPSNQGTVTFTPGAWKRLTAIGFKSGMTDSTPHSEDYERDCGQRPGEPTKEETTVDDLLSLPEGADPESVQTADRSVYYYYDNAGNRTTVNDSGNGTTNYTPNTINQYTAVTGSAITNGPEHEIQSYNNVTYRYINDEHLKQASDTNGNIYNLYYDALGRCVKRSLTGAASITTYYVYDGEKPILEYDASGTRVGFNLYGKGIDEILERGAYGSDNQGHWYFFQQNHEGSITHLTDASGAIIERYRYDVYGAPTIYPPSPGATPIPVSSYSNRFMFTGREYSNMFGFYEYRARAYHAGLGRFMSEDAKLFDAGDYNLFRYCHNDPIDFTDPMGLEVGFGESLIPVWGSGHMAYDAFNDGHYAMATFHTAMAITDVSGVKALGSIGIKTALKGTAKIAAERAAGRQIAKTVEREAGIGYRYVGKAEANSIRETGKIPMVRADNQPKNVFFTNERFTTGAEAKPALSLGKKPEFRVEFDVKQAPAGYGGLTEGGHVEFTLREGAQPIQPNKIIPLDDSSLLDLDKASRHIPPKYSQ